MAALSAGAIRTAFGDYRSAFLISDIAWLLAALSFLFARKLLDHPGPRHATKNNRWNGSTVVPSARLG